MPKSRTRIQKRRRLQELYAKGVEVRFGEQGVVDLAAMDDEEREKYLADEANRPDDERDVVVWVQPVSPLQREQVMREAQAARSRAILAAKKDDDSEYGVSIRAFLAEMDDETLRAYLLEQGEADRLQEAQREVLGDDEWSDFTSLQDAMRQWEEAGMPETEEWQPLIERDRQFGAQVDAVANRLREAEMEGLQLLSRDDLEKRAFDRRLELVGSHAFLRCYEQILLFYACRDGDDHSQLFFESVDEFSDMPEEVQTALIDAFQQFIQEEREAKNSPRAESGSPPSAPPAEPETSEASIPEEVSA